MQITIEGIILSLKNLGAFLITWKVADLRADCWTFIWALLCYALIQIPSDLYLMNKVHERAENKKRD